MRWAFFLPDFRGGGAERAALLLAKHWPVADERPPVIVRSREGEYRDEAAAVEVIDLGLGSQGISPSAKTAWALARTVRAADVDGVVTFLSLPAVVAAKALTPRLRVVWSVQNPPEWSTRDVAGGGVQEIVIRAAMRGVDGVVLPAAGLAESPLVQGFRGPVGRVPNPVDPALVALRDRRKEHAPPRIVAVGRLAHQKRFDVLLEAVRRVADVRGVEVTVYGEGPLRPELERRRDELGLASVVSFPGWEDDLNRIYGAADVVVSSSDYEGFGNTLAEALAAGIPVVATTAPFGPPEILDGGRYGLLVPPGDPTALADALVSALPGGDERPRLLSAARERGDTYLAPAVAARMRATLAAIPSRRRTTSSAAPPADG